MYYCCIWRKIKTSSTWINMMKCLKSAARATHRPPPHSGPGRPPRTPRTPTQCYVTVPHHTTHHPWTTTTLTTHTNTSHTTPCLDDHHAHHAHQHITHHTPYLDDHHAHHAHQHTNTSHTMLGRPPRTPTHHTLCLDDHHAHHAHQHITHHTPCLDDHRVRQHTTHHTSCIYAYCYSNLHKKWISHYISVNLVIMTPMYKYSIIFCMIMLTVI